MILDHVGWFLFAWVFGNQAGVPLPVVPALLGVGALAGSGHLSIFVILGIAVGASLAADLTWYGLGRWRGTTVLRLIGRLAPNAGTLVGRAQHVFSMHVGAFQLGARFLPELNAIAAGLAGARRLRFARFVSYGTASALAWAGAWIGLGYFLSDAVTGTAAWLGIRIVALFVAAFVLYLPFQRARRHRLVRAFRQARIGVHGVSSRHALEDDLDQCVGAGVSSDSIWCPAPTASSWPGPRPRGISKGSSSTVPRARGA